MRSCECPWRGPGAVPAAGEAAAGAGGWWSGCAGGRSGPGRRREPSAAGGAGQRESPCGPGGGWGSLIRGIRVRRAPAMGKMTRRDALQAGTGLGVVAAAAGAATAAAPPARAGRKSGMATERDRVMEVGMTAAEADCWVAAAELAGQFFALPRLHTMDAHEVAVAIHVIQNKLLSRPTYRRYLERARATKK